MQQSTTENRPEKSSQFIDWLVKLVSPSFVESDKVLQFWQERIAYSILLLGIILGPIVLVPSVLLSIEEQLWSVATADVLMYLIVIFTFIRRSLPFQFRIFVVVSMSYGLGLLLLIVTGPFGAGPVWLFFFPVITGILLPLRYTVASLIINVLTIIFFGWLIVMEFYSWSFTDFQLLNNWIVISLNFLFVSTVSTISIVIIARGLETALIHEKMAKYSMEHANIELQLTNNRLTNEINAKTEAQNNLKKSTESLKASELRYQDLVNMMPLGYFLMDDSFRLQFLNQKTIEAFGIQLDHYNQQLDAKQLIFLAPQDRERAMTALLKAFSGGGAGLIQLTALSRDGKEFPIEIHAEAVYEEDTIIGIQGLIVDISDQLEKAELKIARDTAEKTNKAISDWVNFITHEIRTPISAPLGYSRMGLKKLKQSDILTLFTPLRTIIEQLHQSDPTAFREVMDETARLEKGLIEEMDGFSLYFDRILSSSERLNQLLNELLDLSKLESGQMNFVTKPANMMMIVQDAIFELEVTALEKKQSLEMIDSDIPMEVQCDSFRLGQVMRNLLSNALKFTPENKRITVSFDSVDITSEEHPVSPGLKVTVEDEGIGIPEDQLASIFDKFKQSRKTRKGEGTGLGLPICREIVQAHGGRIWVESKEGSGTQFHFTIPLEQKT